MKQLLTIILILLSINNYAQEKLDKREHVFTYNHISGRMFIDNTEIDSNNIIVDRSIDDVIKFTFNTSLWNFEPMFFDFTYDIPEIRGNTYTFYSGNMSEYMQNYDIFVFKIRFVHNPKYLQ